MRRVSLNPTPRALYGLKESLTTTTADAIWQWYLQQLYGDECAPPRHAGRSQLGDESSTVYARKAFKNHAECIETEISRTSAMARRAPDYAIRQAKTRKAAGPIPRKEESKGRGLPLLSRGADGPAGKNLRRIIQRGEKRFQDSNVRNVEQKALLSRQSVASAYDD